MNTMFADVQSRNVNLKESGPRSDLNSSQSKEDKFSAVLSREMRQDGELREQTESSQVIDRKELKSNMVEPIEISGELVNDAGMSVTWLQHLADQGLDIITEAPVEPVEVAIDESVLLTATDSSENSVPLINTGQVAPGEALPTSGKSLPLGATQVNVQSVISMSTLTGDQSVQGDLSPQPKLPQTAVGADDALAIKANGPGESSQVKINDFQMMQSAVAEVVELNGSQVRLQNPSAVISVGNIPQNSLLLPTEIETLSVNNTRDTTAWGNGVGERVHWMINQKLNTAIIRLDPPSLGRLEVNIQVTDDVTKVTINTQHAQTRDIIDNASFKLREFLQENGYQNVSVDVSHQEQQQQASQQTDGGLEESLADNQLDQNGEGKSESSEVRYYSSDSVVDFFA
ncbi:MAG: flagellar hook-length control protein FliK [Gammaproteobacteria bacterium]|nr:flagellar hook-length control protein FliK [Gammaproteobacteria bacterium]